MTSPQDTCWTLIKDAAQGDAEARAGFSRLYLPVIRAYLAARWKNLPLREELDDTAQDVFLECFKSSGVLARADADRPGGFRAYLFGVVRNVAIDAEKKRLRNARQATGEDSALRDAPSHEQRASAAFDRAWATAQMREAVARQTARVREGDEAARKRLELLRLRFEDDLPIQEIANRWSVDPAWLHHEYARAREEFRDALCEVVLFHHPVAVSRSQAEAECTRLLAALG